MRVVDEASDTDLRQSVQRLVQEKAPWFDEAIKEVNWSTDAQFEARLAKHFGRDRCWLVGDAAHQTGPVGMQSMNVGLREADDLIRKLTSILRENAPLELLSAYGGIHHQEWSQLLGIVGEVKANNTCNAWVKEHRDQIVPCLPASGKDLDDLLDQIGLELQTAK